MTACAAATPPEVLVIGAGINGAPVFRELALNGVRVAPGRFLRRPAAAPVFPPTAPLASLPDHSSAEIAWIGREEMVIRLSDLVLRRTLVALRGQAHVAVLHEMAAALGWDEARRAAEVAATMDLPRARHGGVAPTQ